MENCRRAGAGGGIFHGVSGAVRPGGAGVRLPLAGPGFGAPTGTSSDFQAGGSAVVASMNDNQTGFTSLNAASVIE